jgi:cyclopropane fatty-acyl-phospholipid synthase-like methyltransferase
MFNANMKVEQHYDFSDDFFSINLLTLAPSKCQRVEQKLSFKFSNIFY